MWPRPGPSSVWPPPYAWTPSRSHQSYISKRLLSGPKRDGLMFTMRGRQGRSSTSATEWIGASQVTRSPTASRIGFVSRRSRPGPRARRPGTTRSPCRYSSGSVSTSTGVSLYWPFRSSESTAPVLDQRVHQLLRPLVGGVELQLRARVALAAGAARGPASPARPRAASCPAASRPRSSPAAARAPARRPASGPPARAPGRAPPTRTPSACRAPTPRRAPAAPGTARSRRGASRTSRSCRSRRGSIVFGPSIWRFTWSISS